MLKNKTPNVPTETGSNEYKKFEYLVIVPNAYAPHKVAITATMFKDVTAFFNNQPMGALYIGEIEFDIEQAGLLQACQTKALEVLGNSFEDCAVPVAPVE
jgi:hypothetical protein